MADALAAYPLRIIQEIIAESPPAVASLLYDMGTVLGPGEMGEPHPAADAFEAWLIERWLSEVRSEAFRQSADFQFLMGEWEKGR